MAHLVVLVDPDGIRADVLFRDQMSDVVVEPDPVPLVERRRQSGEKRAVNDKDAALPILHAESASGPHAALVTAEVEWIWWWGTVWANKASVTE